jgi:cystathionine beta-lyase
MNFDEPIDRRGTNCDKWDNMMSAYGVSPDDGIAMWVADTDFKPPQAALDAVQDLHDFGIFGYHRDDDGYKSAICGWMERRHNWTVDPDWIATSIGMVNGISACINAFTEVGDGVIVFSPVYHAFHRIIKANNRRLVESELILRDGLFHMDLTALADQLDGSEKILLFCSPHNPGGRIWTVDEQRAVARFCQDHDLLLIADEIHHDIIYPGHEHTTISVAAPEIADRLIVTTAPSKVFNLAGNYTAQVIISNETLRHKYFLQRRAFGVSSNITGINMTRAVYDHGDDYVDELRLYLDGNRKILSDALDAIPGVNFMPMQATYLGWVDFRNTGMSMGEVARRIQTDARVAANHGHTFGAGGAGFMRFNIATQRAHVSDAASRLSEAFADLQ